MRGWSKMAGNTALVLSAIFITTPSKAAHAQVLTNAVVQFGEPHPQSSPAAVTHFLLPDDVTILKGGTVTFVVNGGGHGIAIHEVSKSTTREDIAADLCQGGQDEADREGRAAVCNGTLGTQNLNYDLTDGKGDLVIRAGVNNPAGTNPRVDDAEHSVRLLATSGAVAPCGPGQSEPVCDSTVPAANRAGGFLTGSTGATATPPNAPGNRIEVKFSKNGRYLVICMNRGHLLNDHMFGFVTVVGDENEDTN